MWRVVTKAVDYQSSLRQELAPDVNGAVPSGADDRMAFMFRVLSLDKAPRIEFYGQVPAAEGAIAELIGSPFHSDMQMRPKYIIISYPSGVPMELGRMHLRNVIIRDSDVYYEGTPLVMENVFFVNCRFRIKETPNQSRFVMALMNPGAIHFES
jgi:hypothetical protein